MTDKCSKMYAVQQIWNAGSHTSTDFGERAPTNSVPLKATPFSGNALPFIVLNNGM